MFPPNTAPSFSQPTSRLAVWGASLAGWISWIFLILLVFAYPLGEQSLTAQARGRSLNPKHPIVVRQPLAGQSAPVRVPTTKPITTTPSQSLTATSTAQPGQALLQTSWEFYKNRFLVDGVHVVSNTYGGTISEGQSYALLKAVWMNDPQTFQRVWQWTKSNLRRPHDALLGWRWGDGEFGTQKGLMEIENATDADQDIAYALLLASEKWRQPTYQQDALHLIHDLWRLNAYRIGPHYYLAPGTWKGFREGMLTLDPSYFAPYVYQKFAQVDTQNATGWRQLAEDSYDTLEACTNLTQPKLPPNWCAIPWKAPYTIQFSDRQGEGSRDFSYDAFRVYWRMAMDAKLSPPEGRKRAQAYLQQHPYLLHYWKQHHRMPEGFTAEGKPRPPENSGFAMGPVLILSHVQDANQDTALYQALLLPYYHPEGYWFNDYNDFLHSVIWLHLYALSL